MREYRDLWLWAAAICAGILLAILTKPEPKEPIHIDVDKAAAEVTQKAGKHFTKGVIQAVKEELGD